METSNTLTSNSPPRKLVSLRKNARKSTSKNKKNNSKEFIIELLSKNRKMRTKGENRIIMDYLVVNITFFSKLNNSTDLMKLEKLSAVLNYELYQKNKTIIHYGEEGDKFYVLIEGLILITKPIYHQKTMQLNEYLNYMRKILYEEKNQLKYDRVIEKNQHMKFDMDLLFKARSDSHYMRQKFTFFIEEEEKMGEYTEPFAFGDIALIRRATRNATIKALKECKMVTIEKNDYNRIIREIEEKRIEKQMIEFKKENPLFMYWSINNMIKLFNCCSNQTFLQGDYLYKQNEESDAIYIIKSGSFEMYSLLSFAWASEFFEYIIQTKGNLAYFFKGLKTPLKDKDFFEYITQKKLETKDSPCKFNPLKGPKVITSNQGEDNFEKIRNDQAEVLDPYNLFKVLVKRINQNEVIGIEDALEFKKRFCSVKCVSSNAVVHKINVNNFNKLLSNIDDQSLDHLLDIIAKKKAFLFDQLLNTTQKKAKILGRSFAFRCQKVMDKEKPTEETKLSTFSFRDNVFFDYSSMVQDITEKALSSSLKMSLKKKLKRSLVAESSKHIYSPFINYKNSRLMHHYSNQNDDLHFQTSKKITFSIQSNLSNHSSYSNLRTIPFQFDIKKDTFSRNKYSSIRKNASTSILPTNPSSQKKLKGINSSLSLKTESYLPSLSFDISKPNSNKISVVDIFQKKKKAIYK